MGSRICAAIQRAPASYMRSPSDWMSTTSLPLPLYARATPREMLIWVGVLGVEVGVVRGHEDVVRPQLLHGHTQRARHLVGLHGHVAVTLHVLRRRHAQVDRQVPMLGVLDPLEVVVHAVHPVERPLRA